MSTNLVIAVVTCNRDQALYGSLDRILEFTRTPHQLVVVCDGETGAEKVGELAGAVTVVRGPRRGIGWNYNRALYWYMTRSTASVLVTVEDDSWPNQAGWEIPWVEAANIHGYVSTAWSHGVVGGSGTPADPYLSNECGTQITATKRDAMMNVGYYDTRFVPPYGHSDTDLRWRYGRCFSKKQGNATLGLWSGFEIKDFGSLREEESVRENGLRLEEYSTDPEVYRPPFRTLEENLILTEEMIQAQTYNLFRPPLVEGWLSPEEGRFLRTCSRGKKVIEVGAYLGRSTIWIAEGAAEVTSIDPHTGEATPCPKNTLPVFLENLKRYGVRDKVRVEVGRIEDFDNVLNTRFEFAFVDGEHTCEATVRTVRILAKWMTGSGLIALHDVCEDHSGVLQAVDVLWPNDVGKVCQVGTVGLYKVSELVK